MTTRDFKILCFSFNASGLRLCETLNQDKADEARKGFKAKITLKKPCIVPNFFEEIRDEIYSSNPSLVVITTQDEDSSDTYFHSDVLPLQMGESGYKLLKKEKLNNVGIIPSKLPQVNVKSGTPSGSALRMSVYSRFDIFPLLRAEEKVLAKFFSNDGQDTTTCQQGNAVSGAICSYVWHPTFGHFAFIALDLPSGADILNIGQHISYETYRSASKSVNNLCLISLLNKFVDDQSISARPDHVFLLGDFNYDIVVPNKKNIDVITELANNLTGAKLEELQRYDELKQVMQEVPLLGFKEGVSNSGPLFMPTWKMKRGRPDSCDPKGKTKIAVTCFDTTSPNTEHMGWHDRILFKENFTSQNIVHCMEYGRLDVGSMHESSHAGVMGLYEVKPVK